MISNTRDGRHRLSLGWGARSDEAGEVAVDPEADAGALLGVELGGEDVAVRDDRGERHAVLGLADDVGRVGRIDVIRVDEVEVRVVGDAFQQGMRPGESGRCSSRSAGLSGRRAAAGPCPGSARGRSTPAPSSLDSKMTCSPRQTPRNGRPEATYCSQRLGEAEPFEVAHRVDGRALAGHDQAVGLATTLGSSVRLGVVADRLQRLRDAPEVSGAVVQDRDHARGPLQRCARRLILPDAGRPPRRTISSALSGRRARGWGRILAGKPGPCDTVTCSRRRALSLARPRHNARPCVMRSDERRGVASQSSACWRPG